MCTDVFFLECVIIAKSGSYVFQNDFLNIHLEICATFVSDDPPPSPVLVSGIMVLRLVLSWTMVLLRFYPGLWFYSGSLLDYGSPDVLHWTMVLLRFYTELWFSSGSRTSFEPCGSNREYSSTSGPLFYSGLWLCPGLWFYLWTVFFALDCGPT